jgi:hypothetical protein
LHPEYQLLDTENFSEEAAVPKEAGIVMSTCKIQSTPKIHEMLASNGFGRKVINGN